MADSSHCTCESRLRGNGSTCRTCEKPIDLMASLEDSLRRECRTPGARFTTHVGAHGVAIHVELPATVAISEATAAELESSIHDALEPVFAPFFQDREAA